VRFSWQSRVKWERALDDAGRRLWDWRGGLVKPVGRVGRKKAKETARYYKTGRN
jgi:hypothetical protein